MKTKRRKSEMKKYLIIAAKPSIVRMLVAVYGQMEDSAEFEADFLPVNCHVENVETSPIPKDELAQFKPFGLKKLNVPEDFRIRADCTPYIEMGEDVRRMVKENKYDAIVNACDPDEEGDLEFQYMLESLGLERKMTERIYLFDLSDSVIESELMTLNEF